MRNAAKTGSREGLLRLGGGLVSRGLYLRTSLRRGGSGPAALQGKRLPGGGKSRCKGPKAGPSLEGAQGERGHGAGCRGRISHGLRG